MIAPRVASHGPSEYLIPGADGRSVFTFSKGIIADPKVFRRFPRPGLRPAGGANVPVARPGLLPEPPGRGLDLDPPGDDNARLLNITSLDEMVGLPGTDRSVVSDRIGVEKRFHLVPAASLLVTIPTTNDRLVLRRLDIGESLARLPGESLLVTSPPVVAAKAGQAFRHRIAVLSGAAGSPGRWIAARRA